MDYIYSKSGVCTNPTRYGETIIKKSSVLTNYITIAQLDSGKWTYGVCVQSDSLDAGYAFGCSAYGQQFESKHGAILSAIEFLKEYAERSSGYYRDSYKKVLECCANARKQISGIQLTLF